MEEIRFLETHGDIFCGGKNMGKKHHKYLLSSGLPSGIKIVWSEEKQRIYMTWNNETTWIFPSNIAFATPDIGKKIDLPVNEHRTEDIVTRKRAQVSTPTGHVFEGPGKGKVRDSK